MRKNTEYRTVHGCCTKPVASSLTFSGIQLISAFSVCYLSQQTNIKWSLCFCSLRLLKSSMQRDRDRYIKYVIIKLVLNPSSMACCGRSCILLYILANQRTMTYGNLNHRSNYAHKKVIQKG